MAEQEWRAATIDDILARGKSILLDTPVDLLEIVDQMQESGMRHQISRLLLSGGLFEHVNDKYIEYEIEWTGQVHVSRPQGIEPIISGMYLKGFRRPHT